MRTTRSAAGTAPATTRAAALLAVLALVVAVVAGCSSSDGGRPATPAAVTLGPLVTRPQLVDPAPCRHLPGFTCSTLTVPLAHGGQVPGSLRLRVAAADNVDAPRGVLLMLSGGPGQPGVSLVKRVRQSLDPAVLDAYRMVMFDQRGTGRTGIDCPELQAAVGFADFVTPPSQAVETCAARIGSTRDFYGTPDTVADIEWLRRALGADRLTVDGVSYGTFSGAQYALRYPARVASLVLDSVVPFEGFDPLPLDHLAAAGRVLADVCREDPSCTTDPVTDLAWVVRHSTLGGRPVDGSRLVEALAVLSLSSVDPTFAGIPQLLHDARNGDTARLSQLLRNTSTAGWPYQELSAGLHLATLCSDLRFPWGTSAAPLAGRAAAVDRAVARIPAAAVYPYDRTTARRVLEIQGCLHWPPSRPSSFPGTRRLTPRTLLLQGTHDLFCPLEWGRRAAQQATNGTLVVVPGGGHGLQRSPDDSTARDAVRDFLLG